MKEELLKIAQESLSSDEVSKIVKEKFMNALGGAIEDAFRWGDAKHAIEEKVKEVMVPYIESCYFLEDIGEKVFFTREEAETKLKEMEN